MAVWSFDRTCYFTAKIVETAWAQVLCDMDAYIDSMAQLLHDITVETEDIEQSLSDGHELLDQYEDMLNEYSGVGIPVQVVWYEVWDVFYILHAGDTIGHMRIEVGHKYLRRVRVVLLGAVHVTDWYDCNQLDDFYAWLHEFMLSMCLDVVELKAN